jgi:hypothetical protein
MTKLICRGNAGSAITQKALLLQAGVAMIRDGNSGTGTRSDGYRYENDFLSMGDIRTRPELRRVRDEYFFLPVGNLTGTRYFTTAIILSCE